MASNASSVYIHVLEDVIDNVRDGFINSGADEAVLNYLQALWEIKMIQRGVIDPIDRATIQSPPGPITPAHDLNMAFEGPTAEMLFPPTPLNTPIQTPLPERDQGMHSIPTGPSDYAPSPKTEIRNVIDLNAGGPNPYMQPPSPQMNQGTLGVDVKVEGREDADRAASQLPATQEIFVSSGKRKRDDYTSNLAPGGYLQPQNGSGDITVEFGVPEKHYNQIENPSNSSHQLTNEETKAASLLQQDGINDVKSRAAAPVASTPKPIMNDDEDDEPPLNEDDDVDDDSDEFEHS